MDREHLLKVAEARLHPSLANPNYLVLQSRRKIFESLYEGCRTVSSCLMWEDDISRIGL
jgi:hypothetical protein